MGKRKKGGAQNAAYAGSVKPGAGGDGGAGEDGYRDAEPAVVPYLALSPRDGSIVVGFGPELRVFARGLSPAAAVVPQMAAEPHTASIRAVAFDPSGKLAATGADDKMLKLWHTDAWSCVWTTRLPKKVTAVAFTPDGRWLLAADKFGEVYVCRAAAASPTPALLLAHCCSIITGLAVSPDGRHVATCDRDEKVRLTAWPPAPERGAPDIGAYALGHTAYVTCLVFDGDVLLSGGGDGTVRVWRPETGDLLATAMVAPPVQAAGTVAAGVDGEGETWADDGGAGDEDEGEQDQGQDGGDGDDDDGGGEGTAGVQRAPSGARGRGTPPGLCPAAVLSVSSRRGVVAAVLDGVAEVIILAWTPPSVAGGEHALVVIQRLPLPGLPLPTGVAIDNHGLIWAVGGREDPAAAATRLAAPGRSSGHAPPMAPPVGFVRLAAAKPGVGGIYALMDDSDLPTGAKATIESGELDAAAAQGAHGLLSSSLRKQKFSAAELEARKLWRNDRKQRPA